MAMQRKRRRRSSGNNNGNSNNPNRHYESNGPDVRIRGSAQQILDKYLQYARDAQTSGDRVKAEALFQHAEHYARIVAVFEQQKEEQRKEREERDAARAEERAARQAEAAEEGEAEVVTSAELAAAPSEEDTGEAAPEPVTIEVVDASAEASVETGAEGEESGSDKPKRRRRSTYNRKTPVATEEDGVMKTLARGAEPDIAEKTDTQA
ncbi:MAG: DUF4167 domain-containing protein [Pseudomonadota bacterium]